MVSYGYTITDVLNAWQAYGVFAYLLPFLLIFAIVFGILNKTRILGDNKGVQAVIALALGLLALQFDYVTNFYATIFPYAGVGLAVLLLALIFLGVVAGDFSSVKYIWFGVGIIVFIAVVFTSLSESWYLGGMGYSFWEAWPTILAGLILVAVIGLIVWGGKQ